MSGEEARREVETKQTATMCEGFGEKMDEESQESTNGEQVSISTTFHSPQGMSGKERGETTQTDSRQI